jgi:hypothetical protein
MPRDEREQRLIEKTELPEELEEKLDELLPCDLVDLNLLAQRLDMRPIWLLNRWLDEAEEGHTVPRVIELSSRVRRVSLAEFKRWVNRKDAQMLSRLRQSRLRQAREDLPQDRRRPVPQDDPEMAAAKRELRSLGDLER